MKRILTPLFFLLGACATASGGREPQALYVGPPTAIKEATDTYHGVEVKDAYRWLEDFNDPAVKEWSTQQNAFARKNLDALPRREEIEKRVREIYGAKLISYYGLKFAGGKVFAGKFAPPKNQPFVVVMDSPEKADAATVVLDPVELDPSGSTAMDWFQVSHDGKYLAASLSKGGSESGDVTVFDVATKKPVFEVVPRVNGGTAGGSLAWDADGKGFYYTRYPRGDERPAIDKDFFVQVYHHTLGTPTEQDKYELGKDFPRIAEIMLDIDAKTGRVLATVQNGDGGEFAHYVRGAKGDWTQLTKFDQKIVQMDLGPKDNVYFISRDGAPKGKLLRAPIAGFDAAKAEVIIPEGEDTLVSSFSDGSTILITDTKLFATYQLGGPNEIRVFSLDGKAEGTLFGSNDVANVGALTAVKGDIIAVSRTSFIEPRAWWLVSGDLKNPTKLPLNQPPPVDLSGMQVIREFATSKDGTKVPVSIVMKKGAPLDGSTPFLVTGYGGYGVNIEPYFAAIDSVLFDRGVALAVANLRGGGEYGEAWHKAGNLTHKQNVFDDFSAVLEHLVAKKYTESSRLVIEGGSNGGLLMGAVLTQHPTLMKAVVSSVGIYDMLRVELSPNGAFNVPEFGTVKDPELFKAMYAYSPYHHVVDGTAYPPVLFITGDNDPRVDPMQSRKMTARLQAATGGTTPVLLRTSANAGHGMGTALDERVAQVVDEFSFILSQLGLSETK
ncbi:MAG: prolyl oligopeptidase family serine peptidase [Myxococcota bacterium]